MEISSECVAWLSETKLADLSNLERTFDIFAQSFALKDIISVTGHKNTASLVSYVSEPNSNDKCPLVAYVRMLYCLMLTK